MSRDAYSVLTGGGGRKTATAFGVDVFDLSSVEQDHDY